MKPLLRLLVLYFTGTALARAISVAGLLAIVLGSAALRHYLPRLTTMIGVRSDFSLAEEATLTILPLAGTLTLFFGSALLPTIFGRLAASRQMYVLPRGRGTLLASALIVTVVLALVTSTTSLVYYVHYPISLATVFGRVFVISFVTYSALYVALWVLGRLRSALGLLTAAMLVLAALALPITFEGTSDGVRFAAGAGCAGLWCAFGAGFMLAPRWRARSSFARWRLRAAVRAAAAEYSGGDELDLALGTHRPWLLALGQLAPLAAAALLADDPRAWFLYFALLGAIAVGIASTAAARSRALWLRVRWDRAELFARVERAYWRHSAHALGVLSVALVALGIYRELPARMLGAGIVTLIFGMLACMYLGLMMTRGVGWRETLAATGTMAFMMATAVWVAAAATTMTTIVILECTLLALAATFRLIAKRRWNALDWLLCRPERTARANA